MTAVVFSSIKKKGEIILISRGYCEDYITNIFKAFFCSVQLIVVAQEILAELKVRGFRLISTGKVSYITSESSRIVTN